MYLHIYLTMILKILDLWGYCNYKIYDNRKIKKTDVAIKKEIFIFDELSY